MRILIGVLCLLGGVLGFLPILGFWMFPLGLMILSIDFPPIRRFRRKNSVRLARWLMSNWPAIARRFNLGKPAQS